MDEPDSILDGLNPKLPEPFKVIQHGLELFGGVPLPS